MPCKILLEAETRELTADERYVLEKELERVRALLRRLQAAVKGK